MSKIVIGKDGWPVELIQGRPVLNFFRKIIHGRYRVSEEAYRKTEALRFVRSVGNQNQTQALTPTTNIKKEV